ncbi:DUF4261 domain-containing protein [Saccharibacillus brassicae]|nr:DUF4261 domain-containing protein [Saccharibacillus brassicae]
MNEFVKKDKEQGWQSGHSAVPGFLPDGTLRTLTSRLLLRKADDSLGAFSGFAEAMLAEWQIETHAAVAGGELVFKHEGMTVRCRYVPDVVPNRRIEHDFAENPYLGQAQADIERYAAYIEVSVSGAADGIRGHMLLTQTVAALLDTPGALAIHNDPKLFTVKSYRITVKQLKKGRLPATLWGFIRVQRDENGVVGGHTFGLPDFGMPELEVTDTLVPVGETYEMMMAALFHIFEHDVRFSGGEKISFRRNPSSMSAYSPEAEAAGMSTLRLVRSPGVQVAGESLKIEGF